MLVKTHEALEVGAPPAVAFDYLVSVDGFLAFPGYGPVPGIAKVEFSRGSRLEKGTVLSIGNTDGSTHREEITAYDPPRAYAIRIDSFSSPLRLLVHWAEETWRFEQTSRGTRIEREFVLSLRSVLFWPLSLAFTRLILKRAMQRHHDVAIQAIEARAQDPAVEARRAS
jgi:hypothetical protein